MTASLEPTIDAASVVERSKRPYYGWVVVGAAALVMAGFVGTLLSFGVFLKPLESEFGWSRGAISGAMSLCIGVQGMVGLVMGRFTDRYDMGFVVAFGTLAGAAAYLFLSQLNSLWHFYLGFGVGAGVCSGCAFTPITATVSKWFDERRRTMALGVTLAGVMIGQMALAPIMDQVIQADDWRKAYVVAAIVVVVCGIPGTIVLARRPPHLGRPSKVDGQGQGSDGATAPKGYTVREAVKTAPFWMLIITAFAISCGFYIFMSQIVAHARDVALEPGTAALILTFSGVGSLAGSLLAWWFERRTSGQRTLLAVLLLQAVATFLFTVTRSPWSFFAVATVFGFCYGTASPVRMGLVAPLFGLKCIGALLGSTTFAWSVGGLVGPAVAGYVHDATQEYVLAFVASGVIYVLGAVSVWLWGSHKASAAQACEGGDS